MPMTIAPTEHITIDETVPFKGITDDGGHDRAALVGLAGDFLPRAVAVQFFEGLCSG